MIHLKEVGNSTQVDLCGYLNVNNIVPIVKKILKDIHPSTELVEFHFEEVRGMDTPAMAMIVITAKN